MRRREAEEDAVRAREEDERKQAARTKELEELKLRYEREGGREGIVYKGRGQMKARSDGSSGGMRGW